MASNGTSINKKVFIADAAPSTKDLASYQALTWTQVKGIVSIGRLGFNHNLINRPDLESGVTTQLKGAQTGQGGEVAYYNIDSDAGQTAVEAACAASDEVSIYILDPDGVNATYWTGEAHSLMDNEASETSYEGQTFTFTPNYQKVRGAAPA